MSRGLITGCALLCVLSGCGPSASSLAGKYKGEMISSGSDNNLATGIQRGLASSISLEIKEDKTFHMIAMVVPVDGTWALEGDKVTLTPKGVLGFSKSDVGISTDRPMVFRVSGDKLEPAGDTNGNRFRFLKEAP